MTLIHAGEPTVVAAALAATRLLFLSATRARLHLTSRPNAVRPYRVSSGSAERCWSARGKAAEKVDPADLGAAQQVLERMNFDNRFVLRLA
jgi:hypothetical protein